jgi:dTDP-4-dehydrorhamnose 3,5-epimerase
MKKKLNKQNFFKNVVIIFKTKKIINNKGNLQKFVDIKSNFYKGFGEIYFTEIKKNKIKGWKKHTKNFSLIKTIFGEVQFTFYYKNNYYYLNIKEIDDIIIQIPPNLWFSFKGISKKNLLCNFMNKIYSDKEVENIDLNEFDIKKIK